MIDVDYKWNNAIGFDDERNHLVGLNRAPKSNLSPPRSGEGPWIGRKALVPETPQSEQPELRIPSAVGEMPAPDKPPSRNFHYDHRLYYHHDNVHGNGGEDSVRRLWRIPSPPLRRYNSCKVIANT